MIINTDDFILTPEKAEKIKRKIEVLRIKQAALTTICCLFEKYNGKVLNKRVFDGVKQAFDSPALRIGITTDSLGCLKMSLHGEKVTYTEGQYVFYCSQIKAGDRLDYEKFKAESWEVIDRYGDRAAESEKALKTVKTDLKKAFKAFETIKTVAYSLPYDVKEEFKLLNEVY